MNIQEWKNIMELTQKYQTDQFWKDAFSDKNNSEKSYSRPQESIRPDAYPKCDIYEDEQYLLIEAEVPGLCKEDLHVSYDNNTLTISGEFRTLNLERVYLLKERPNRKFAKKLFLPSSTTCETIHFDVTNGLLKICLPR